MTSFLRRLSQRALGQTPTIRARPLSRFEAGGGLSSPAAPSAQAQSFVDAEGSTESPASATPPGRETGAEASRETAAPAPREAHPRHADKTLSVKEAAAPGQFAPIAPPQDFSEAEIMDPPVWSSTPGVKAARLFERGPPASFPRDRGAAKLDSRQAPDRAPSASPPTSAPPPTGAVAPAVPVARQAGSAVISPRREQPLEAALRADARSESLAASAPPTPDGRRPSRERAPAPQGPSLAPAAAPARAAVTPARTEVVIDRIDVRLPPAPSAPARRPARSAALPTLADCLSKPRR